MKHTNHPDMEVDENSNVFQLHVQLARTNQAIMLAFEKSTGIHPTRWQILNFLNNAGQTTQKELSKAIFLNAGALTRILKQFEANGWIVRKVNSSDNRLTDVSLTASGRKLLRQCAKRRRAFVNQVMSDIDEQQASIVSSILTKIGHNLQAHVSDIL